ncbi:cell death activator CIDE-B-like [Bufo gargarizans]|uniref:cell death activator CIDE-B-like n=1 Tax=Bufo gargarizans TaxID=30331 RepID=UPI001CF204F6|nr:cell death activator CIDE-B-like [Bufo gargarizans]XP_044142857.1 cell death activator CIDE-B-like [Bufo gargarizans]
MEFISNLGAGAFRSVSSVGSEISRRVKTVSAPPQRPFRVCSHDRSVRKGVTAGSLRELIAKAMDALFLTGIVTLVLEEDGTLLDTEEYFDTLEDGSVVMVLEKQQKWNPRKGVLSYSLQQEKPKNSRDIARITFDVYKLNPRDVFGSLNIKATFYGLYSMSCDFQFLGPKKVVRELMRLLSAALNGMGRLLLTASGVLRRLLEGGDHWQNRICEYEG